MDLSIEYRSMCLQAQEIQDNWNPLKGDYMISKASYCGSNDEGCTEEYPCIDCLEMDNTYVISGQYNYHESVGGTHWFFGGHACVKGDGNMCNDTACYIMTNNGHSTISHELFTSNKTKMLWLPRQDQIQAMFLNEITPSFKIRKFINFMDWLDHEIKYYDTSLFSLEMLWLIYFMYKTYNKEWDINKQKWIQIEKLK